MTASERETHAVRTIVCAVCSRGDAEMVSRLVYSDDRYSLLQKYRRSTWVESLRAPGWGIGEGPSKAGGAVAADPPI